MRRAVVAVAVLAVVGLLAGVFLWAPARSSEAEQAPARRSASPMPVRTSPSPLEPRSSCPSTSRPFAPTTISMPGVARAIPVIDPPRDAAGVPGVPPLTTAGAHMFAWDREQGIRPGDRRGNVLLNAHTWPDGSALGNQLLAGLHQGDRIVVQGRKNRLCYRVTKRIEVRAADGYPPYYAKSGRPRLAIIVCSGRRLGPGDWENRTIWFATPRA